LPFDVERDGTVLSEGAAVLVLESEEHAQARGADILCELAGYGVTADAYHIAAPDPNGTGAARAMQAALRNAGATPEDVTFVCAHGTGTPLNDISESKAIAQVLGEKVPVMSNKYSIGHTLGAAGAISSVMAVCALQEGVIPGTLNLRNKDPECPVNAIRANVCAPVHGVLVNAFGFGGQNASLFFRRYGDGQA
jgi:3-oxoacyl-[acyl-carrier-protein] synthase II